VRIRVCLDGETDRAAARDNGLEVRLATEDLFHERPDNSQAGELIDLGVEVLATLTRIGLCNAAE
jgi:hypothetical protein